MNHPKRTALKEANDKLQLTVKEVSTVTQALELLRDMSGIASQEIRSIQRS